MHGLEIRFLIVFKLPQDGEPRRSAHIIDPRGWSYDSVGLMPEEQDMNCTAWARRASLVAPPPPPTRDCISLPAQSGSSGDDRPGRSNWRRTPWRKRRNIRMQTAPRSRGPVGPAELAPAGCGADAYEFYACLCRSSRVGRPTLLSEEKSPLTFAHASETIPGIAESMAEQDMLNEAERPRFRIGRSRLWPTPSVHGR